MHRLVLLCLLSFTAPVMAQPSATGVHELSASYGSLTYGGFFRSGPGVHALELAYHRGFGAPVADEAPVRLGVGFRAGIPNSAGPISGAFVAGEVFGQVQLRTRLGPWEPVVGPELGLSGLTAIGWNRGGLPEDVYIQEQQRVGGLYVGVTLAPLRFRWSTFTASLAEVSIGTTLSPPGATSRVRLGLLSLGVVL